ncbi:MAG: pyridoxamine 5'-phosphate oxidase family protein [Roseicyclus sp.]|nr:pyridoxamine 5'-phosphate oxidase family protein [Roseicyclus sp.]
MPLGAKLNGTLRAFVERQKMFFVATAAPEGRVNLSPKGADSLRIIDDTRIMWLSLSGSGNETAGHLLQSDRMTLMFCAFEGDALILRVFGRANALHPRDPGWADAVARFPAMAGTRQIFDLTIDAVRTSCGTGVPHMAFEADRVDTELMPYFDTLGADGVARFWARKNVETIDGYPTGLFED